MKLTKGSTIGKQGHANSSCEVMRVVVIDLFSKFD